MRLNRNSCHVFYLAHGKSEAVCRVLSRAFTEYAKAFRGNDAFLPTSVRSTDKVPDELEAFQVCHHLQPPRGATRLWSALICPDLSRPALTRASPVSTAQIDRSQLTALKVLGSGVFGKVYLADQALPDGSVRRCHLPPAPALGCLSSARGCICATANQSRQFSFAGCAAGC